MIEIKHFVPFHSLIRCVNKYSWHLFRNGNRSYGGFTVKIWKIWNIRWFYQSFQLYWKCWSLSAFYFASFTSKLPFFNANSSHLLLSLFLVILPKITIRRQNGNISFEFNGSKMLIDCFFPNLFKQIILDLQLLCYLLSYI